MEYRLTYRINGEVKTRTFVTYMGMQSFITTNPITVINIR